MPDYTFTKDDVSKALAIALLTNHGLTYRSPIPPVADATLAPKATQGTKRVFTRRWMVFRSGLGIDNPPPPQ